MLTPSVLLIQIVSLTLVLLSSGIVFTATAQTSPPSSPESSSSQSIIKVFLPRAIEELENGNSSDALEHLKVIDQELLSGQNLSSTTWVPTVRLLVQDAIEEVQNMNESNALTYLNLASERMGTPISSNQSSSDDVTGNVITYDNTNLGIKVNYPASWSIVEYPYNPAGNNTIVGFFSDQKTSLD